MKKRISEIFLFLMSLTLLHGCAAPPAPETAEDPPSLEHNKRDIYLAGGCFWGLERCMEAIPGVLEVVTGYANGTWEKDQELTYEDVCTGTTGFREAVRVTYDPDQISLDAILFSFFHVIDPTVQDRQGPDIGSQYQTGVYYTSGADKETVDRIAEIERSRYPEFFVEIEPLGDFRLAEEYHQNYLDKNPNGYCHIAMGKIGQIRQMLIDPGDYRRPDDEAIRAALTQEQFDVTQNNGTEPPFDNEFWNFFEPGIYVDVVSGEPLFSSADKFKSGCGWPAFSKGMDINTFFFISDSSDSSSRLEVRSRAANSHLGHVFQGDPDSPTGTRYCINSTALRFISYDAMEAEGYGYLMELVTDSSSALRSYTSITPEEAKQMMDGTAVILDVREPDEYAEGHVPGAVLLPLGTINAETAGNSIPAKDTTVLVYCRSGNRSKLASVRLTELGYSNIYDFGGIRDWPYEVVTD